MTRSNWDYKVEAELRAHEAGIPDPVANNAIKASEKVHLRIEKEFNKFFSPEVIDKDHTAIIFDEDMMKVAQWDRCEEMEGFDNTQAMQSNWVFPFFSKSRIRVIKPENRLNAPKDWHDETYKM